MPGNFQRPYSLKKDVFLGEWWLRRSEKDYNGRSLAVGGYSRRGDAVTIFNSAPIIKRHDPLTLETDDGITLKIQGSFNQKRSLDNGFPIEDATTFAFGFPISWDNFANESSRNKFFRQHLQELEIPSTFESSFEQKTVLLRDWWLRRTEKAYEGNTLGIGGFTEWGKARRFFNSSPIIMRRDAYTLETADGITIRILGFINRARTLDNGFPLKACKIFFVGFPSTWADFVNESSENNPPHAETPLSAKWSNGSFQNMSSGSPGPTKNRDFDDNAPSISNTFFHDSTSSLREIIRKFTTQISVSDTEHIPSTEGALNHLPEKSSCENDLLQVAESCETNMRYDNSVGNDSEHHEAGCTTVGNDSEHHEVGRTEGAGACDLHADRVIQDHGKLSFARDATFRSVNKQSGCALPKGHHGGGFGDCNTSDSSKSVVGKDLDKEEVYEKYDKCGESSARTSKKARSGSSKLGNFHGEDLKVIESSPQPTRRSKRLMLSKLLNVQGEYRDYSQFPSKTNDLECANLTLDASKGSRTGEVNDIVAKGTPLSPTRGIPLPSPGMFSVENGDAYQHSRKAGLAIASKSNSPSKYVDFTSAATTFWQNSYDKCFFSSDHRAGVIEGETYTNSNAATSNALERKMKMQDGKNKDSETTKRKRKDDKKSNSRMKVKQNDFRNQLYFTNSQENISFKSSTPLGRKANMKRNLEDAKKLEGVIDVQQTEDEAYCTTRWKTIWVSCYKDVYRTPLTRYMGKKLYIHTPESLNLKRSRSGRVIIPPLDCTTRILYEADGSIIGTAAVAPSLFPLRGSQKMSDSRMGKRQR